MKCFDIKSTRIINLNQNNVLESLTMIRVRRSCQPGSTVGRTKVTNLPRNLQAKVSQHPISSKSKL